MDKRLAGAESHSLTRASRNQWGCFLFLAILRKSESVTVQDFVEPIHPDRSLRQSANHDLRPTEDNVSDTPDPAGRKFSFARKTWLKRVLIVGLLLTFFLIGRGAGWITRRLDEAKRQREGAARIRQLGGHAYYEYQYQFDGSEESLIDVDQAPGAAWLNRLLGPDFSHRIFYVSFAQYRATESDTMLPIDILDVTDAEVSVLTEFPSLRWVALNGTRITDAALPRLERRSGMERLWLNDTEVTDAGMKHVMGMPDLTYLFLGGTRVSDAGLAHLGGLTSLERLDLSRLNVTDAGMRHLEGLVGLERLFLDATEPSDAGMQHLARLPNLKFLSLRGTEVGGAGMQHLQTVASLEYLFLDGTRVADAGMRHVGRLSNLESLSLANTYVGDAGVSHLSGLINLQSVSLSGTHVGDAGLNHLGRLDKLKVMYLDGTNCTFSGVVHLFTHLQHRSLDDALEAVGHPKRDTQGQVLSLDLSKLRVGDAGLVHLKGLTKLEWLYLNGTQVGDAGLEHLTGLNNLTLLHLADTNVSDAGLDHLVSLPRLRTLHLAGTRVSDAAIEDFIRARNGRTRVFRTDVSR